MSVDRRRVGGVVERGPVADGALVIGQSPQDIPAGNFRRKDLIDGGTVQIAGGKSRGSNATSVRINKAQYHLVDPAAQKTQAYLFNPWPTGQVLHTKATAWPVGHGLNYELAKQKKPTERSTTPSRVSSTLLPIRRPGAS